MPLNPWPEDFRPNILLGKKVGHESAYFRTDAGGNSRSHHASLMRGRALFLGDWFHGQMATHSVLGAAWPGPTGRPHAVSMVSRGSRLGAVARAILDGRAISPPLAGSACSLGFDEHCGSRDDGRTAL